MAPSPATLRASCCPQAPATHTEGPGAKPHTGQPCYYAQQRKGALGPECDLQPWGSRALRAPENLRWPRAHENHPPPPTSNPRQPGRVRHSRTGASAVVASGPCPEHQAAPWASGVWLVATSTQLGSEGPRVPGAGHSHPHLTDNETASVWGPGTLAQPEAPGLQGILAGSRELWLSPQPTTPWLGGSGLGGSRPHLETL